LEGLFILSNIKKLSLTKQKVFGMHKPKVLHISRTSGGGAGWAACHFNELIISMGLESNLIVKDHGKKAAGVIEMPAKLTDKLKKIKRVAKKKLGIQTEEAFDSKYCFFSPNEEYSWTTADEILGMIGYTPDLIFVHFISEFINFKVVNEIQQKTNAKVVWVMMDESFLTGGCHFPWDCNGYKLDCSNCPAILDENKKQIAAHNFYLKSAYLNNNNHIVALSEHDAIRLSGSQLFKDNPKRRLLFPINENQFFPVDKKEARQLFQIREDQKVIFYGALTFDDPRKGAQSFKKAIELLENTILSNNQNLDDYLLLLAGINIDNQLQTRIPIKAVGRMPEEELNKLFSASDLYVSTSLEDSGPLMINMSIMSGTPVVSFAMGVAFDLVNEHTGALVPLGDADLLAAKIFSCLNDEQFKNGTISKECRSFAMRTFSFEATRNKVHHLLEEIFN
jgi:glycosyltransferase involved in cell wall biosynthesis